MLFNRHSDLEGRHARLSASNYHWTEYDEEKMARVILTAEAAARGTALHNLAHDMIKLKVRLEDNGKTLNSYVNDAIRFRMTPELVIRATDNAFGTADAVSFRDNKLRIHDLKTGVGATSIRQLEIYAAFFCIEYRFNPRDIDIEMRIYQNDEVKIFDTDINAIIHVMEATRSHDQLIDTMRMEALG